MNVDRIYVLHKNACNQFPAPTMTDQIQKWNVDAFVSHIGIGEVLRIIVELCDQESKTSIGVHVP